MLDQDGGGYDESEKDGLYIIRSLDNISLSKNFTLRCNLILLQRYLKQESKSFREKIHLSGLKLPKKQISMTPLR